MGSIIFCSKTKLHFLSWIKLIADFVIFRRLWILEAMIYTCRQGVGTVKKSTK